jgi:hypothetical protein
LAVFKLSGALHVRAVRHEQHVTHETGLLRVVTFLKFVDDPDGGVVSRALLIVGTRGAKLGDTAGRKRD